METTVPFSGFYNTVHDDAIDQEVKQMFSDRATGWHENEGLESALFGMCNYTKVFNSYAKAYCEAFAGGFGIPSLKFVEMNSPREYNFETDRVFAKITLKDAKRLRDGLDKGKFRALAAEKFTSRSGFWSFYDPDTTTWGPLNTWDANQVGTILQAHADENSDQNDFSAWEEFDLMEGFRCNGYLENWICEATPGIDRLFKIHDYIEKRAERETAPH